MFVACEKIFTCYLFENRRYFEIFFYKSNFWTLKDCDFPPLLRNLFYTCRHDFCFLVGLEVAWRSTYNAKTPLTFKNIRHTPNNNVFGLATMDGTLHRVSSADSIRRPSFIHMGVTSTEVKDITVVLMKLVFALLH